MSMADVFRNTSSIVQKAVIFLGVGLSTMGAFNKAAHAGDFYDQCMVFTIDSSASTQPKGWTGQVRGIAAGISDSEVIRKIEKMHTGIRFFVIGFSGQGQVKIMKDGLLKDASSALGFASYMNDVPAPYAGNNDLLGALGETHNVFKRLESGGAHCGRKVVDFSGDGGDVYAPAAKLQEKVLEMARDGITIHGFSFVDVRWNKFTKPDETNWHKDDRGKFADIHDYYDKVIVTPAGIRGAAQGRHYAAFNLADINTEGTVEKRFIEIMRDKVRYEVAGLESDRRVVHARLMPAWTTPPVLALNQ